MTGEDDDDGYVGYVPATVDLGSGLVVGAVFAFFIGYGLILPLFVYLGRRREARRKDVERTFFLDDIQEEPAGETQLIVDTNQLGQEPHKEPHHDGAESVDLSTSSSQKSTASSHSSVLSSAIAAILDHPQVPKTKAARKRRRLKDKQLQGTKSSGDKSEQSTDVKSLTLMQGIYPGGVNGSPVRLLRHGHHSAAGEVEATFEDALPPGLSEKCAPPEQARPKYAEDFNNLGMLDKIATVVAWDVEMKRIVRLSMPYCVQALFTGLTDTMNVAVIGKLIGTREVSAFVIVNLLVELTSEFVGGLHEALFTLCSQAIGANNKKLAGQYVQIVVIFYTVFFIPFMIMWAVYMGAAMEWLGFDEETVRIGAQYTYILVVDLLVDGLGEAVHSLLDVGGFEKFSTLIGATEEILAFLILLFVSLFGNPDLVTVGLIQLGMGILFLVINVCIIHWKGWFKPYLPGMIGTFALSNARAVWLVCRTALSLSFGMLLTDGEWEILTIFASFLGPAEVAAWGILDTIWRSAHELIDGIADASEVRCAYLLGYGEPYRAELSAYKSILIGSFAAVFLTSLIYIAGDDLPTWLTNDPTLQKLLSDLLPLFGIANFVMALDTMSWTLLGSQGRYRLATFIVCLASWLVTIPLAVLFSVHWNVNLQGQMTAFITGYLVMGITHSYFLLRSDWDLLSMQVMKDNAAARLEEEEIINNNNIRTNSNTSNLSPHSQSASMVSGSPMLPMEVASGTTTPEVC